MSGDEEPQKLENKENSFRMDEIAASSIRSGLAELELKTSQVLQHLENVRTVPHNNEIIDNTNDNDNNINITPTKSGSNKNDVSVTQQQKKQQQQQQQQKLENPTTTELFSERKPPSDILKSLEHLISYSESDDDPEFPLPALDDISHLALISHSMVAYLTHLDRQQLLRVTNSISNDTTRWLGEIFRFYEPQSSFHLDNADAILRVVRLALVACCPGYLENGIPSSVQLCFYISENTAPLRLQYACHQLGIPMDSIRLIPTNSTFGTMDMSLLQKQVQNDVAAKRKPLLLIADIGASLCGYVDNLVRMHEICLTHNMWLHATGHSLAALACTKGFTNYINIVVNSIALNLGSWLGVPSVPIVILHREIQNNALTAFESDPILSRRLNALSLWTSLQALGYTNISERIRVAFQATSILFEITSKCEGIRVLSRAPGAQTAASIAEVLSKPLDFNILFEASSAVVVFQFDGSSKIPITNIDTTNDIHNNVESYKPLEKMNNVSYFDRLNSWLGQILQRDCPNFDFEIFEHQVYGTCIRCCPLELGLGEQPPSSENLENFAHSLETHVDILRATIKHKATFMALVEGSNVLRLVNLPDWAGMGGVRFVPEGWETLLTDQAKTELNKLNIDLVDALKSTDNAFSLGEGNDGLICVRFGMVTHETDVDELLDLVVTVGKSVQENSRVLDTMSEIVKKGIEAATADLQRETEEKLWQEGILRHVPVVGRVFNWWSPPIKESGIKGRSLNLTQGVVESTENIYKYHMQMSGAPNQLPANKSPPTPMVQTPVVADKSPTSLTSANEINLNNQQAASTNAISGAIGANNSKVGKGDGNDHIRSISQSSESSSVPELVPVNNNETNINNN